MFTGRKEKNWKKKHTTHRLWSPCSFCSVSSSKKPSSSSVFLRPLLFFRKRRCCCCRRRSPSSPSFPSSGRRRRRLGNRRTHRSRRLSFFVQRKVESVSSSSSSHSFFLFFFLSKTLNIKPYTLSRFFSFFDFFGGSCLCVLLIKKGEPQKYTFCALLLSPLVGNNNPPIKSPFKSGRLRRRNFF